MVTPLPGHIFRLAWPLRRRALLQTEIIFASHRRLQKKAAALVSARRRPNQL
jgi:hypothetical protein